MLHSGHPEISGTCPAEFKKHACYKVILLTLCMSTSPLQQAYTSTRKQSSKAKETIHEASSQSSTSSPLCTAKGVGACHCQQEERWESGGKSCSIGPSNSSGSNTYHEGSLSAMEYQSHTHRYACLLDSQPSC